MSGMMNSHGGTCFIEQRKVKSAHERILDYSINIHPLPLCSEMKDHLVASLDQLEHYPEIDGASARVKLANQWQLNPSQLILGNGAMSCIYLYARTYRFQNVMIISPTFNEYERAFSRSGTEIIHHIWELKQEPSVQWTALKAALQDMRPACLVISNPNNPTGNLLSCEQLVELLNILNQWQGQMLLDESFIELSFGQSMKYLFQKNQAPRNLFIIASLTKYYSIPGLRLGVGIGNSQCIRELQSQQEPWQLNEIALTFLHHIELEDHRKAFTADWLVQEIQHLTEGLQQFEALQVYRTQTNFLLLEIAPDLRKDWLAYMASGACAIFMRVCDDFIGLEKGRFLRIAVKSQPDNQAFLEKTQQFFQLQSRNEVKQS